jgi:hypothetical protein
MAHQANRLALDIDKCRLSLVLFDRIDSQPAFHDAYLKACAHITASAPEFPIETHELLIQAPPRVGKSTSIAMFAAAMVSACPNVRMAVYTKSRNDSLHMLNEVVRFSGLIRSTCKPTLLRVSGEEVCFEGGGVVTSVASKMGTTKGMDSDIIIVDDAALTDPSFFNETVCPVMDNGKCVICISTPTSDVNFYSRLCRKEGFNVLDLGSNC